MKMHLEFESMEELRSFARNLIREELEEETRQKIEEETRQEIKDKLRTRSSEIGLGKNQRAILDYVEDAGRIVQSSDISENLGIHRSAVSGCLSKLRERGLVTSPRRGQWGIAKE